MGAHRGGIEADGPVDPADRVVVNLHVGEDAVEGTVGGPPPVALIDGLPVAVPLRQVPPRGTGGQLPQDPVQHRAVIGPPAAPDRPRGQKRLDPPPRRIGQLMPSHHDTPSTHSQRSTSVKHQDLPDTSWGVRAATDMSSDRAVSISRGHS